MQFSFARDYHKRTSRVSWAIKEDRIATKYIIALGEKNNLKKARKQLPERNKGMAKRKLVK